MSRSGSQSSLPKKPQCSRSLEFATTRWSLVRAAGEQADGINDALEELCRRYWYPLYAYVRRRGHQVSEAQDLTQGFMTSLLQRNTIGRADPERGRFRSFLLGSFKLYLSDERQRQQAQKRGGHHAVLSIDTTNAEQRYRLEPVDNMTPEDVFERRWAITLLNAAVERVRVEYSQSGKLKLYEALQGHLGADKLTSPNVQIASDLGMKEGAVRTAAHRLRNRFREVLRAEISETVSSAEDLETELQELFRILGGH